MTQQEALALADHIHREEAHITATAEPVNRDRWRIRLTFRADTPHERTLTACTQKQCDDIRIMWSM